LAISDSLALGNLAVGNLSWLVLAWLGWFGLAWFSQLVSLAQLGNLAVTKLTNGVSLL
jgi:hypothetical protein